MKIEGSIQEIKEFMKEFQSKDAEFTKRQLAQIREEIKNTSVAGTTDVKVKIDNTIQNDQPKHQLFGQQI